MFSATTSVALVGIEARAVRVEVHVGGGKPIFSLVGLPDAAVREAKERVRAALASSGFEFPNRRVTVNLAPADLPKAGSAYDLPIALGVLAASRVIPSEAADVVALGELALDGSLRAVRGGLGAGEVSCDIGAPCVLPPESAAEALLVSGAEVRAASSLAEAVSVAVGSTPGQEISSPSEEAPSERDLMAVRGQARARRALEVTAAGGHHLLLTGPPGTGKTLLASCLPSILPTLTDTQQVEVAKAWSAAGRSKPSRANPPFRSPHHSATPAALLGGGSGVPSPGELTLAHHGVLFLDELGEFPPYLLDGMRQPLEEGSVHVARRGVSVEFPCDCQVVAATNPCPCGFMGDERVPCGCSPAAVARYRRRFSGPFLDRFDIRTSLNRPDGDELLGPPGETSAAVRSRVVAARLRQTGRGSLNRNLEREEIDRLDWSSEAVASVREALSSSRLSGRGFDRVRKVAVTIADLAESDRIEQHHVAEALGYREDFE